MKFMLITASREVAAYAVDCGVDRIFVDLEALGKAERQRGRDTVLSGHTLADVRSVRSVVPEGCLLVRIDPWNESSRDQIESVLRAGADLVMLPMFRSMREVEACVDAVAGRATVIPLVETVDALAIVGNVARHPGVGELHVGLNDLHLEMRRRFMFELLTDGTLDDPIQAIMEAGKPFGIGGVARIGSGAVPAELVLAAHVRFGSTRAILSRAFHGRAADVATMRREIDLAHEVAALRRRELDLSSMGRRGLSESFEQFRGAVSAAMGG